MWKLIGIIRQRVWHSFASAVIMAHYREVDSRFCLSKFSKPYALTGCTCITKVKAWARKWKINEEEIAFVFEDGDKDKGDLIRCAQKHFNFTPVFLKKEKTAAFQAADLLAYEHLLANTQVCKRGDGVVTFDDLRQSLKELSTLPGGFEGNDWGVHREDDLTDSCIKEKIQPRSERRLPSWGDD